MSNESISRHGAFILITAFEVEDDGGYIEPHVVVLGVSAIHSVIAAEPFLGSPVIQISTVAGALYSVAATLEQFLEVVSDPVFA